MTKNQRGIFLDPYQNSVKAKSNAPSSMSSIHPNDNNSNSTFLSNPGKFISDRPSVISMAGS